MTWVSAIEETPQEQASRQQAEQLGEPFLVYRGRGGRQTVFTLHRGKNRATIGRGPSNDIPLPWDTAVSRVHAELERVGDTWTLVDDGLSRSGTLLNGERIRARRKLRDGDVIQAGETQIALRIPRPKRKKAGKAAASSTNAPQLTQTQRRVLEALCRPYKETEFATPATNQAIAEELFLSSDAVKAHIRGLVTKFGLDELPISQRRPALAMRAMQLGLVD